MTDQARIDMVLQRTTPVVRAHLGQDVVVRDAVVVAARARSLVVRCHLKPRPAIPRSLIVKQHTGDDARAFSDWASLAFLSALDGAHGVAPRFYGGDTAARLIVMEDLGRSRTMTDVVAAGYEPAIHTALRSLAEPMARLVAATAGPTLEARYARLRGGLPGGWDVGRHQEARRWRAGWPAAAAWFAALGCPIGATVEADVARVAAAYAEPGQFLAFSHGDPAPSNNHIGRTEARLLDFEYGAFRHALYDLTGWYVLCPLPEAWATALQDAFRRHLVGVWPPADDEPGYGAAWAAMCAYRALAMLSWLPLDILGTDRPWVEDWTMRGALLTAATRLGRATAGVIGLAALGEAGDHLAQAVRARWPELGTGLPRWPESAVPAHPHGATDGTNEP